MRPGVIVAAAFGVASAAVGQEPGQTFRDCPECPEMIVVPSGTFLMGSVSPSAEDKAEAPQHRVTIAKPFALGKYEVTFAEWDACTAAGGCRYRPDDEGSGRGRRPAVRVSWEDAKQYVAWLSRKTGKNYRLPSEAEWEYAARAGTTTNYFWGDDVGQNNANCGGCESQYSRQSAPVGSFKSNPFGIHDMHGNAWEWAEDCWNESYEGAPNDGRAWLSGDCRYRIRRGGSWYVGPDSIRSANRGRESTNFRGYDIFGLRVARNLD